MSTRTHIGAQLYFETHLEIVNISEAALYHFTYISIIGIRRGKLRSHRNFNTGFVVHNVVGRHVQRANVV
jgi:hypothetical protein